MEIPPATEVPLVLKMASAAAREHFRQFEAYVCRLARVRTVSYIAGPEKPHHAATAVVDGEEVFVPLEGVIDLEVERTRLTREIDRISGLLKNIDAKLANPSFVERAPKEVVEKERGKLVTFRQTLEKLQRNYDALQA
jgi:valyl-tRNA synthetase